LSSSPDIDSTSAEKIDDSMPEVFRPTMPDVMVLLKSKSIWAGDTSASRLTWEAVFTARSGTHV
jgi:hypothetical protein